MYACALRESEDGEEEWLVFLFGSWLGAARALGGSSFRTWRGVDLKGLPATLLNMNSLLLTE